jgi:hypothetical protein
MDTNKKEEFILFLFPDDIIVYFDATKWHLDLINTFGKVAGYKINNKTLVAFLYTNNKQAEKEIRKSIAFTIVWKNTSEYT